MPRFFVEQRVAGAGGLSAVELQAIARQLVSVLRRLGPEIQWVWSYVTDDRLYSLFYASHEALIREHAHLGGLPAHRITYVRAVIDPATGEV
jgi:hypothetical protein